MVGWWGGEHLHNKYSVFTFPFRSTFQGGEDNGGSEHLFPTTTPLAATDNDLISSS